MKLPDKIAAKAEELAAQRDAGQITRQEAVTALRDVIMQNADRAFLLGITAEFAGRVLDARKAPRYGLRDTQSDLFPDLPVRLFIRPGVAKPVILFTAHDWDTARAVLENRTSGAVKAAEADWAAFDAAYARVRPLLTGDLTTADVAGQIDGETRAATP